MVEQVSLALTCRYLIQVSSLVVFEASSALAGTKVSRNWRRVEEDQLLRVVQPLDSRGRPRRACDFCVDCLQYRPTRKSYWKKKRPPLPPGLDKWTRQDWESVVAQWNAKYLRQCPESWYQERLLMTKEYDSSSGEVTPLWRFRSGYYGG